MEEDFKSEGKCLFCGKTFAKAGINKHFLAHLKEMTESGEKGQSFLVKVETKKQWGPTPYFLSFWIDGEATFKSFDKFLRDIWLECCGHMSAFNYQNKRKKTVGFQLMPDDDFGDIPMNGKVKKVFLKGLTLDYEYDFGSTTALDITVIDEFPIKAQSKIVLLSRNEPIAIPCSSCKKVPATKICTVCMYEGEALFCNKCAPKHAKKCDDFDDYAAMSVVNSPRMGICGYEGGTIDKERD